MIITLSSTQMAPNASARNRTTISSLEAEISAKNVILLTNGSISHVYPATLQETGIQAINVSAKILLFGTLNSISAIAQKEAIEY